MIRDYFRFFVSAFIFTVIAVFVVPNVSAASLVERLRGHILLQVEDNGEAWYVDGATDVRWYMGRPADAFQLMRTLGLGISNKDLARIPRTGSSDVADPKLVDRLVGRILLQVEEHGEAWYVSPRDNMRHFLGRPTDAFTVMRVQGLGISTKNLESIAVSQFSSRPIIAAPLVVSVPLPPPAAVVLSTPTEPIVPDPIPVVEPTAPLVITPVVRPTEGQQDMLDRVNGSRRAKVVPQLGLNETMNTAALVLAQDMIDNDYFSTHTPDGKGVKDFLKEAGYEPRASGVLIADGSDNGAETFGLWNGSDSTEIINKADYEELGVAYVKSATRRNVWVVFFASSQLKFEQKIVTALADTTQWRNAMLARINQERAIAGRLPLNFNPLLHETASAYSEDMLVREFFAHEDPDGSTPHQRITNHGYPARTSAENLAKGPPTVQEAMDGLMNSPGHKANILLDAVDEVGLGLALGRDPSGTFQIYWTQHFGKR